MTTPWFQIRSAREKIAALPEALSQALATTGAVRSFELGRDAKVVFPSQLPPKPGLSCLEGHARLLHDLASIELQAMELAVRTLWEFPEAPREFREQLAEIALSEGQHLDLCIQGIEHMGYSWGHWDVHISLWNAVGPEDSLLDRILIVHRYLEGSGLDAGDTILRRLSGVEDRGTRKVMGVITSEEVGHVMFGSRWFHDVCRKQKLDSDREFKSRIDRICELVPRREKIAREARMKAGFTPSELDILEEAQARANAKR